MKVVDNFWAKVLIKSAIKLGASLCITWLIKQFISSCNSSLSRVSLLLYVKYCHTKKIEEADFVFYILSIVPCRTGEGQVMTPWGFRDVGLTLLLLQTNNKNDNDLLYLYWFISMIIKKSLKINMTKTNKKNIFF